MDGRTTRVRGKGRTLFAIGRERGCGGGGGGRGGKEGGEGEGGEGERGS